jgi:hypothetical protein
LFEGQVDGSGTQFVEPIGLFLGQVKKGSVKSLSIGGPNEFENLIERLPALHEPSQSETDIGRTGPSLAVFDDVLNGHVGTLQMSQRIEVSQSRGLPTDIGKLVVDLNDVTDTVLELGNMLAGITVGEKVLPGLIQPDLVTEFQ